MEISSLNIFGSSPSFKEAGGAQKSVKLDPETEKVYETLRKGMQDLIDTEASMAALRMEEIGRRVQFSLAMAPYAGPQGKRAIAQDIRGVTKDVQSLSAQVRDMIQRNKSYTLINAGLGGGGIGKILKSLIR